jgi:hypothetical protein
MAYMANTQPSIQVIHIHPQAPIKPEWGVACNGCGVCCLSEPCPLGVVLSRRRRGACSAVQWNEALGLYRCGAIVAPRQVIEVGLAPHWFWLGRPLAWVLGRLARRWIAAGVGCDSSVETGPMASTTMQPPSSGNQHD